ncbi:MAG: hypothetical protein WC732_06285 [Candidatus Omnitrophota bacterium]
MNSYIFNERSIAAETKQFYRQVLGVLYDSHVPFLAGGAYALGCYTGITRDTKDFDVFIHPRDINPILKMLRKAGYETELTDKKWLGKAFSGNSLVDIIFGFANGTARVDGDWFSNARQAKFLNFEVRIVPPEEMVWSKAYLMTRDRFDGADIVHILLCQAESIDWKRLLLRFDSDWRLLYNYLILFGYIYPTKRQRIPSWIMRQLAARLKEETKDKAPRRHVCRGTYLSTTDYTIDVGLWEYADARKSRAKSA